MDLFEAIRTRRAVRNYQDRPLAREVLGQVLDHAVWAPSGMNLQPWCFVVLEGRAALAEVSAAAKAHLQTLAVAGRDLPALKAMLESPAFNIFYNAPALVVICATTDDEMALKDACLAGQTLMLAARGLGLGTCWIGLAEAWLNSPAGKRRLGVPDGFRPVAPIIIGHPEGEAHPTERRAPDVRYML
jgi:nitroreductase